MPRPTFRIFNPILQGRKFDTAGAYIRKWVPELARLDDEALHAPWEVPPLLLGEAGVVLGKTYPRPLVEHGMARDRALAALSAMRET
jgi:deoxyribodipyrimidine photo-lyase